MKTEYNKLDKHYVGDHPPTFNELRFIDQVWYVVTRAFTLAFCIVAITMYGKEILICIGLNFILSGLFMLVLLTGNFTWYDPDNTDTTVDNTEED